MVLSEYEVRKQKAETLRSLGIAPYAEKFDKKYTIQELLAYEWSTFRDVEEIISAPKHDYKTAGRITLFRTHGKLSFGKLLDESGEIQLMFHKDNCQISINGISQSEVGEMSAYKMLEKLVDVGDFIGVEGELFMTHKGELTLFVNPYTFLAKAIQPLGDKFHGIGDDQERAYRYRYLDMIFNRDTLERMKLRSKFLKTIREFYRSHNFTEIETPVLGNAASGAAARPFVTHHHDFDLDMYLRISPETNLKKATVGMLEKVFEVAKDFRNEWSDPSHHQEFTMIEHYAAYRNHEDNMKFTEEMFDYLFAHIPELQKTINVIDKQWVSKEVSFQTPRQRINYIDQIKKDSWIDVSAYGEGDDEKLRNDIKKAGHTWEAIDKQWLTTMIDYLYKKVTRPKIVGPAFIVNYPKLMQPLARTNDNDKNIVEQRQLLINGWEVIKAYSELVDPVEQQANFDAQASALAAGDEEATAGDPEFVQAMEYGMPPQSGRGMGIDRIFALLTEQQNIRDVILFPMMKPMATQNSQPITHNAAEEKSVSYENLPKISDAQALADKYLTETRKHCEQVGKVMQYFAKKLNQDEDAWYIAWLLHDVDRDHIGKDASKHLDDEFHAIVWEISLPQALIDDIRSHYHEKTWVPIDLLIRKYLASVDELSGFLYAYSLMRPEGFQWMEANSVMKKIKDKKFAAWVNREHLANCETYLGIPLKEFIPQVIEALTQ